jgi:hypothetical protein
MNEFMENKISEAELNEVTGGTGKSEVRVRPITPIWVRVTASSLNCRYTPNGEIAKIYERGHKLKVDGITEDGEWYRLLIYDPKGGMRMNAASCTIQPLKPDSARLMPVNCRLNR